MSGRMREPADALTGRARLRLRVHLVELERERACREYVLFIFDTKIASRLRFSLSSLYVVPLPLLYCTAPLEPAT